MSGARFGVLRGSAGGGAVFAVTKVCFSLSGGLFDGAGVVVLVAGEGCAASEGLLAVGVGTLVWPLAGVDSAVSGERGGVAEGLAAAVTHVRLFAGVDAGVDCQGRALDELFTAAGPVTRVRSNPTMNALYSR